MCIFTVFPGSNTQIILWSNFDLSLRLEYEKKRDMGARIAKLESSQNELKSSLVEVDEREKKLKSVIEKATEEIDTLKEEVQGTLFSCN